MKEIHQFFRIYNSIVFNNVFEYVKKTYFKILKTYILQSNIYKNIQKQNAADPEVATYINEEIKLTEETEDQDEENIFRFIVISLEKL